MVNNSPLGAVIAAFGEALALDDAFALDRSALQRAGRHLPAARALHNWLERAANSGASDLDDSAVIATITDGGRSPA